MKHKRLLIGAVILVLALLFCSSALAAQTLKPAKVLAGHPKGKDIYSLAISPKGDFVITASRDKTLKIWSLPGGRLIKTLKGHRARVTTVALSPGGRYALSGSQDTTVKLWDLSSGKALKTIKGHKGYKYCIAISPDGKYFALGSERKLELYAFPSCKLVKAFPGKIASVECLAFSPRGKLFSGHIDRKLNIWRVPDCKPVGKVGGLKSPVLAMAISRDDRYRLIGLKEYTKNQKKYRSLKLWKPGDKKPTTYKYTSRVSALAFSADNRFLIVGDGFSPEIRLLNRAGGAHVFSLKGHKQYIRCLAATPDGRFILSGDSEGGLLLWKIPGAGSSRPVPLARPANVRKQKKAPPARAKPAPAPVPPGSGLKATRLGDFKVRHSADWRRAPDKDEATAGARMLYYLPHGSDPNADHEAAAFFKSGEPYGSQKERIALEMGFLQRIKADSSFGFKSGHIKLAGKKVFWARNTDGQDTYTYVFPYRNGKLYTILFLTPGGNASLSDAAKRLLMGVEVAGE